MADIKVAFSKYGKAQVRVLKINKSNPSAHVVHDFDAKVLLAGTFEDSYSKADNSLIVATDTVKNTIYYLPKDNDITSIEQFGILITQHFLRTYSHVNTVFVDIDENLFDRINVTKDNGSSVSPYSFVKRLERAFTKIVGTRGSDPKIISGIKGLHVMKTTDSGFENFHRDEYTTLPETRDRVFRTEVVGKWKFRSARDVNFTELNATIRDIILSVFAGTYSYSVQDTMYRCAKEIFAKFPQVENVTLTMPNIHCIPVNTHLPTKNPSSVLQVTSEPYGHIHAKFTRSNL